MIKINLHWILSVLFFIPFLGKAQALTVPLYGEGEQEVRQEFNMTTLETGERLPWFLIPEVKISKPRIWTSEDAKKEYLRLRRNVLKVLPYAIFAQKRYDQLDRELALVTDKKEQKRLIESCEAEVKNMFNKEIKNMSISQGQILIKLIDRQTGHSSYEMVKEMKGGLTAFLYQGVAKIFGHNLKTTYNPQEDFEIENIIRELQKTRQDPRYF
ncbi:DUF4294 domain-containing protein [Sphingobacterium sp. SRCM116780]|uniref:DUF4294 domain-containing protein n=1 Tax=Sphingobacterium sp. SRCM116780 TaxID=2907623 RepID=UPI001F39F6D1|nr:DUF4294 domain-containing protein [Sphingobacterium sp. SRCM116780]UIR57560.1 DUF4294 domain-containing protein [Sphingobacterium sp. SRCM116780]